MADGTTYKRCSCTGADGKELGQKCPKLRRPGGGWSNRHGIWSYQIELPATVEGKRRGPLRRSGFATQDAANAQLVQVRELLALADLSEVLIRNQIAGLIKRTLAETGALPSVEVVRRRVRTRQDLTQDVTIAQWLEEFFKRKRKIEVTTRRSYESHIRLYLTPYLGHIRLDQLRVGDVAGCSSRSGSSTTSSPSAGPARIVRCGRV